MAFIGHVCNKCFTSFGVTIGVTDACPACKHPIVLEEMAFISRHKPTDAQVILAFEKGFQLVHVGDADAFTVSPGWVHDKGPFGAVAVVHPAAALRLCEVFEVGIFENANRAPEGEPVRFEAVALHMFNLVRI